MTHARVGAQHADGEVVVTVSGEVDLDNASSVEMQVHKAISNDARTVVLDVGDVAYIDSVGMRVLFALAATLDSLGIGFSLRAPEGTAARRVIELSGLD